MTLIAMPHSHKEEQDSCHKEVGTHVRVVSRLLWARTIGTNKLTNAINENN